MQQFADDVSPAAAHRIRWGTIALAEGLVAVLTKVLKKLRLSVALPKCHNFIVDGRFRGATASKEDKLGNVIRGIEEQNSH